VRFAILAASVLVCAVGALGARADQPRRSIDMGRVFDAGSAPEIDISPAPPDPRPMAERFQWVFDLRWDRGDVWLLGIRTMDLLSPQPTPRVMGRFALELFEGPTLVERVRFDFPLLALPDASDAGAAQGPALTPKLRTRIGVVFPATSRGTRLDLLDRATGRRWSLPWPIAATEHPAPATRPSQPRVNGTSP
jgi:hypothetical protein